MIDPLISPYLKLALGCWRVCEKSASYRSLQRVSRYTAGLGFGGLQECGEGIKGLDSCKRVQHGMEIGIISWLMRFEFSTALGVGVAP